MGDCEDILNDIYVLIVDNVGVMIFVTKNFVNLEPIIFNLNPKIR